MYKYGISLYQIDDGVRIPHSGVDVRLVRPGYTFDDGIQLTEGVAGSAYYECVITDEADMGFYEIWDDRSDEDGAFSGRNCVIGMLDSKGIQDGVILSNHLGEGVVTGAKIANESIGMQHLNGDLFTLNLLEHEIQDASMGTGIQSNESPADPDVDESIVHVLSREYAEVPFVILSNYCNCFIYIKEVQLSGSQVTITLAVGNNYDATEAAYDLIAITK